MVLTIIKDYINIKLSLFVFAFDNTLLDSALWLTSFNKGSCIICVTILWFSFSIMGLRRKTSHAIS